MGPTAEKILCPARPPRTMTQWLFRPYWRRVRIERGERVYVSSSSRGLPSRRRSGRLRYWGKIHCAEGYWAGVELDLPHGQNDGSLDGIRYFLCHPNRGLFVRIARCRTRAGYSEVNERHVSFATRTLGKKVCDHGWSAKVPKRNRPFATGPRGVKNGSSSPHLTETSKEGSGTLTSRSAHRPQRVDARLNTTTWVAGDISETARGDLHRYGLNAPRQGTQPESDSPERVSSEISLSESDLCQIDLDQVLDQVLTMPANQEDTANIRPAGGLSKDDRKSTEKLAEMERRRQNLINSYARWAKRRGRHQRGDAGYFSHDSCKPGTSPVAPGKRGTARDGKENEENMRTPAAASCHGRGFSTGRCGDGTTHARWSREGSNDRALVLFSAGSSKQLFPSQNFRRARIIARGRGSYNYAARLAHGVTLCHELQFLRGSRLSSNGYGVIPAPPAETEALSCPAEITERALAIVLPPPPPDARISVVACAEPATAMPLRIPKSILGAAQTRVLTAPPEAAVAITAPRRPNCSDQEIEQRLQGSSFATIPSRRPVIGTVTNIRDVEELPHASGLIAGTNNAGEAENNQAQLLEPGQKCKPPSAAVWPGSGFPRETSRRSSGQNVVAPAQSILPEGKTAEREVCLLLPKVSQLTRGASMCQQTCHVGSDKSIHLTEPDVGKLVNTVKERASRIPPQHSRTSSTKEASDDAYDILAKADSPAVIAESFARHPTHNEKVVSFLGNGGMTEVKEKCTSVQVVDIALPVGGHSALPRMEVLGTQPQGFDQHNNNDGSGPLLLCDARVLVDDSSTSTSEIYTQQGPRDQGLALAPRPFRRPTAKISNAGVDSVRVDGELRIVPHGFSGCAVRTSTRKPLKEWKREPHPTLAIQGDDNEQHSKPWCNSIDSIAVVGCQQASGQVGAPPADTRLSSQSRHFGGNGSPNAMVPLREIEPVKPPSLPQNMHSGSGKNIIAVQPVTDTSSKTEAASIQDEVGVLDVVGQLEDNVVVGLNDHGIKHSARDNQQEKGGGALFPRDRDEEPGKPGLLIGGEIPRASPVGTPSIDNDLPPFLEGPAAQQEAPPSLARGEDNLTFSTVCPPPSLLFVSPCYPPRSLQLATVGEPVVHETEREGGVKLTTVESISAVPVGGILRVDSMAGSVTDDSSRTQPSPSSGGVTPQPPSSSPLLHSPPKLPLRQPSQPLFAITDTNADLGASFEIFSTGASHYDTKSDENGCVASVPVVHWRPYGGQERCRRVLDASGQARTEHESTERRRTIPVSKPVAPPAAQIQNESTEAPEQVPASAQLGGTNEDLHTSRPGLLQQALEPIKHVESDSETCARPRGQMDGNKHTERGSRHRYRQRYPPPPGPPPSPTPDQRRGVTSPYQIKSERSAREGARERRANVVAEGIATVETPAIDLTGGDHGENRYGSSPRPLQSNDRLAATDSQEDAMLLGLSVAVVRWLPPPTPPPPEARRRRQQQRQRLRKPSPSPTVPPTPCATRVVGENARTPPPPYPRNRDAGDGNDTGRREESEDKEGSYHSGTGVGSNLEHVDESGPRRTGGTRMGTTRADGAGNPNGQVPEGLPQLPLDDRDHREAVAKGGWASSCEGSAARRCAEEVLARIAALETSFDRVEEQIMGTPVTKSITTTESIRKGVANAPGVESPTDAVASTANPVSSKTEPPRADPVIEIDNKYSIGDVVGGTPTLPLPNKDPCPAVCTGLPSEPPRRCSNHSGDAVPVAMRELGRSIAGSTENEWWRCELGGNGSNEQQQGGDYYFDLGRSMMLGSFE